MELRDDGGRIERYRNEERIRQKLEALQIEGAIRESAKELQENGIYHAGGIAERFLLAR